jgi:hypothetical protein
MLFLRPLLTLSFAGFFACSDNVTPPGKPAYVTPPGTALACVPNLDGAIDANELRPVLDVATRLLVSPAGVERTTTVVPAVKDGKNRWDYSIDYADDQMTEIRATPIKGKWYAGSFPVEAFALPFDAGGNYEAIYTHDAAALALLGLASKVESPAEGKTLWAYTAPVKLYQFPLRAGTTYSVQGDVQNGTARGAPYAARDSYNIKVDAAGQVDLPDLIFEQALRVRVTATVAPVAGAAIVNKQVSFLSECTGEIARLTSNAGETNDDFTTAKEMRRLGL